MDCGMTVPPPHPESVNIQTTAIYDPLTTRDLDLLLAVITAGRRMVSAVHPTLCPLWHDLGEVITDLNAAWWRAFKRENPDVRVEQHRPLTNACAW
jgi:hypothetical protein